MSQYIRTGRIALLASLLLALPATLLLASDDDERVFKRGSFNDDLYLAGAEVELQATVNGDVTVAGGELRLEGDIRGDVMAAGGKVSLSASVSDDVRLAGGELNVSRPVGDDVIAAGGRIRLDREATVGGRAWLAGGDIRVDNTIAQELRAVGGRITIHGQIQGDVYLQGDHLVIGPGAVITGKLYTKGPREARIADGARIDGGVSHTPVEVPVKQIVARLVGVAAVLLLSLMLTGIVLYLMFPNFAVRTTQSLRESPWPCLGFGVAVFAVTPAVVLILLMTGIGVWLALLLLAAYLIMLLLGYLTGVLFVGDSGLRLIGKKTPGKLARVVAFCVALILLVIIGAIPLLGGLIFWLVLIGGMGALKRQMYLAYKNP